MTRIQFRSAGGPGPRDTGSESELAGSPGLSLALVAAGSPSAALQRALSSLILLQVLSYQWQL